jgi:hypothetical protein
LAEFADGIPIIVRVERMIAPFSFGRPSSHISAV